MRSLTAIIWRIIGCKFEGRLFRAGMLSPRMEVCLVHMTQEKSGRGRKFYYVAITKAWEKTFFR